MQLQGETKSHGKKWQPLLSCSKSVPLSRIPDRLPGAIHIWPAGGDGHRQGRWNFDEKSDGCFGRGWDPKIFSRRWQFKQFICSQRKTWGNDPIWRSYFSDGWVNHQLVFFLPHSFYFHKKKRFVDICIIGELFGGERCQQKLAMPLTKEYFSSENHTKFSKTHHL